MRFNDIYSTWTIAKDIYKDIYWARLWYAHFEELMRNGQEMSEKCLIINRNERENIIHDC